MAYVLECLHFRQDRLIANEMAEIGVSIKGLKFAGACLHHLST